MKKLFFLILLFAIKATVGSAQEVKFPIDSLSKRVSYQGIVQAPGVAKSELYLRAREWFAKTFVSAQAVIQMDDKEAGKIIGKGVAKNSSNGFFLTRRTVYYTITIVVKDGRYRYEISDFYYDVESVGSTGSISTGKLSLDDEISNPKNIKKDGEYKGKLKDISLFINTEGILMSQSLKDALKAGVGSKSKDDF